MEQDANRSVGISSRCDSAENVFSVHQLACSVLFSTSAKLDGDTAYLMVLLRERGNDFLVYA